MKQRLIVFLVALSAICLAQEPPKITLSTPAVTARTAVEMIAKASGAKLSVAEAAADEIVILHVTDALLDSVLQKLADVTSCKWVTDADGIKWLRPDDDARRKQARAELDAKTAEMVKALQRLTDTLKPKKEGEAAGPMSFMGSSTAASKAIAKLSMSIQPSVLAAMKDGDRIVFATSPTRMQRPLGNLGNAISDLVQEHNKAVADLKAAEAKSDEAKTNEQKKTEQEMEQMFGEFMGAGASKKPITTAPTKVLLIASKGGFGYGMMNEAITLNLKVYDAQGTVVLSGRQSLGGGFFSEFMGEVATAEPKPKETPTGTVVKLSPTTAEFVKFSNFNPMEGGSIERNPSKTLLERLLSPDIYDPLSYVPSEALIALAKNRKTNLIAALPDSIVSLSSAFGAKTDVTDEGYFSSLRAGEEVVSEETAGWITIRPSKPTEAREERLDRTALRFLLETCHEQGTPTLGDMATYARKNLSPLRTPIALTYLMYFAPGTVNPGMRGLLNWDLLRLYGTLSDAQKTLLSAGRPIPFAGLMPNQKGFVERLVFGASAQLIVLSREKPATEGGFMEMIRQFMPRASTDFKDEPTEVMPNGLPSNGLVRVALGDSMFVVPVGADNPNSLKMFGSLGTDEFAMLEYMRTDPQFAQFASEIPKIDKVRAGKRTEWDFTFVVAEDIGVKGNLQDDNLPKDAAVTSVESLPQSWKDRVAKRVAAFKKNPLPFQMGGGGSGPPPAH